MCVGVIYTCVILGLVVSGELLSSENILATMCAQTHSDLDCGPVFYEQDLVLNRWNELVERGAEGS